MAEYIEREAVINELFRYGMTEDGEAVIRSIPSADVVPVKHGKWIKSRQFAYTRYTSVFTCSECNKSGRSNYNYCPNCGARMEVDG